jgi:hypothetical protein
MWLVSGAFIYTAFQRAEKGEDHVEKVCRSPPITVPHEMYHGS